MCLYVLCTSWYLRENRIIFKFRKHSLGKTTYKKFSPEKILFLCYKIKAVEEKKSKGTISQEKMSGFQNAAGDRRESTVIFKLVLNILFSTITFHQV